MIYFDENFAVDFFNIILSNDDFFVTLHYEKATAEYTYLL